MCRSKIAYILGMAAVFACTLLLIALEGRRDVVRYYQHLEQPSEADLGDYSPDNGELCTHLPILSIDTGGQMIPGAAILDDQYLQVGYQTTPDGQEEILVDISLIDTPGEYHRAGDTPTQQARASFRIRGNTSRAFTKPSYRIELVEDDDPEVSLDLGLLGMDPASEWSLHGPFLDKTLMRNYLCMNLAAEVMGDAPDVRFCEVLVNGEYRGVYLLMEMITEGPGRVDLTNYEPGDPVFSYMFRLDAQKSFEPLSPRVMEDFSYYTLRLETGARMELLYPGARYRTQEVMDYVTTDLSEIERRLYSREQEMDPDSCWEYLDLDSFANYYILHEFLGVNDMFSASTYFYKDVRGKLHIGPAWDFNNALNNYVFSLSADEFMLAQKGWYGQIMRSERFVEYVIDRYRELRRGVMSEQTLVTQVEDTVQWLGSAVDRNFEVWGYTFDVDRLTILEKQREQGENANDPELIRQLNPASYDEAIDMMLDYLCQRGRWMDGAIDSLRQYCHPSKQAHTMFD